jgi:hypothetical protein
MEMRKNRLHKDDKDKVLDNFLAIFDNECSKEMMAYEINSDDEGFSALDDFYSDYKDQIKESESLLVLKLCKGVITSNEMKELESIALIKYAGLRLDEVYDFYLYVSKKEKEILSVSLSEVLI